MRIALIISCFYPVVGGAEKQLFLIAKELVKRGYTVDVFTRRYQGLSKYEIIEGININRIYVSRLKQLEKILFISNCLIKLFVEKKYNLLIASQFGTCSYISKIYKKVKGVDYLARCSGKEAEIMSRSFSGKQKFKNNCNDASGFITINKCIKNDLVKLGVDEEKILFITNGVKNKLNVLFCGRIEYIKGIDMLLAVWKELEQDGYEIMLNIVGDGSLKSKLMDEYIDLKFIKWVGEILDTSEYYKNSKLLIVPSRYEGISNTILEAKSYGLPVIATAVGGNCEIIKHNVNGYLCNPDIKSIKKSIINIINNDTLLEQVSDVAFKQIESEFDISKKVNQLEEILLNLNK